MREEVLARMKAAREDPEAGAAPADFRFQALQACVHLHLCSCTPHHGDSPLDALAQHHLHACGTR